MIYYYVNPLNDSVEEIGVTPALTVNVITMMLSDNIIHELNVYDKRHLALHELYNKVESDKKRVLAEYDERLKLIDREYYPLLMKDK